MNSANDTLTEQTDSETGETPVVLAVDDEERITQAFQLWLDDRYEVRTANSGEEAFEKLDEDVDVVLLDRQMPGLSGGEVLDRIRGANYGCRVAMVTGVDPDFDIVEMPFDDYVQKPVGREELQEVVERLLSVSEYDEHIRDYFATAKKQATLEAEKPQSQLEDSEEYAALLDELQNQEERMNEVLHKLDPEQFDTLFRELSIGDVESGGPASKD